MPAFYRKRQLRRQRQALPGRHRAHTVLMPSCPGIALLRTDIGERSAAVLRTAIGERSDAVLRTAIGERSDAVLRTAMPGHDEWQSICEFACAQSSSHFDSSIRQNSARPPPAVILQFASARSSASALVGAIAQPAPGVPSFGSKDTA